MENNGPTATTTTTTVITTNGTANKHFSNYNKHQKTGGKAYNDNNNSFNRFKMNKSDITATTGDNAPASIRRSKSFNPNQQHQPQQQQANKKPPMPLSPSSQNIINSNSTGLDNIPTLANNFFRNQNISPNGKKFKVNNRKQQQRGNNNNQRKFNPTTNESSAATPQTTTVNLSNSFSESSSNSNNFLDLLMNRSMPQELFQYNSPPRMKSSLSLDAFNRENEDHVEPLNEEAISFLQQITQKSPPRLSSSHSFTYSSNPMHTSPFAAKSAIIQEVSDLEREYEQMDSCIVNAAATTPVVQEVSDLERDYMPIVHEVSDLEREYGSTTPIVQEVSDLEREYGSSMTPIVQEVSDLEREYVSTTPIVQEVSELEREYDNYMAPLMTLIPTNIDNEDSAVVIAAMSAPVSVVDSAIISSMMSMPSSSEQYLSTEDISAATTIIPFKTNDMLMSSYSNHSSTSMSSSDISPSHTNTGCDSSQMVTASEGEWSFATETSSSAAKQTENTILNMSIDIEQDNQPPAEFEFMTPMLMAKFDAADEDENDTTAADETTELQPTKLENKFDDDFVLSSNEVATQQSDSSANISSSSSSESTESNYEQQSVEEQKPAVITISNDDMPVIVDESQLPTTTSTLDLYNEEAITMLTTSDSESKSQLAVAIGEDQMSSSSSSSSSASMSNFSTQTNRSLTINSNTENGSIVSFNYPETKSIVDHPLSEDAIEQQINNQQIEKLVNILVADVITKAVEIASHDIVLEVTTEDNNQSSICDQTDLNQITVIRDPFSSVSMIHFTNTSNREEDQEEEETAEQRVASQLQVSASILGQNDDELNKRNNFENHHFNAYQDNKPIAITTETANRLDVTMGTNTSLNSKALAGKKTTDSVVDCLNCTIL
jgi:hypothetical protein